MNLARTMTARAGDAPATGWGHATPQPARSHFFVTGLPRSRTAWLSVWLSGQGGWCEHDAFKTVRDAQELHDWLTIDGYLCTGDSDSALLLHWEAVAAEFPEAPWLLVRREAAAAREAFDRAFATHPYPGTAGLNAVEKDEIWGRLVRRREELAVGLGRRCLGVEFAELEQMATAEKIWRHLRPDARFEPWRWEQLNGLRIEVAAAKVRTRWG